MNGSCPAYEWVMSPMNEATEARCGIVCICMLIKYMSHVPHMNESCPTYECGCYSTSRYFLLMYSYISNKYMSHVPHMDESCPTDEWGYWDASWRCLHMYTYMSHTCLSHVTCGWVMSCIWMSHVLHIHESCPTYECGFSSPPWYCLYAHMAHTWMSHVKWG